MPVSVPVRFLFRLKEHAAIGKDPKSNLYRLAKLYAERRETLGGERTRPASE